MTDKNAVALRSSFEAMNTQLDVSMDDVVSAFVAKYENNLFSRKKELTSEIRLLETSLSDNTDAAQASIDDSAYTTTVPEFDLKTVINGRSFDWDDGEVTFNILITRIGSSSHYGNQITISRIKRIPARFIKLHTKINDELALLRRELAEVLEGIKSVNRKERQVRGQIAIRKLEDSGYASLMDDPELAQLVQL